MKKSNDNFDRQETIETCLHRRNTSICYVQDHIQKGIHGIKKHVFCHLLNNISPRCTYASGLCSDLKVPSRDVKVQLLLLTATFNNTMLGILQKMIGIRVLPCNYLWAGRGMMARRHIRINVSLTFFALKEVKQVIHSALSGNLNKKIIVYTTTAASIELLLSETESWMDLSDEIKEHVLVIQGDLQPEVKFISAEKSTRFVDNP